MTDEKSLQEEQVTAPEHLLEAQQQQQQQQDGANLEEEEVRDDPKPVITPPPNGGTKAWIQVFGGFFAFFNSWGIVNSFGAYQDYYQSNLLKHESPSTIAWIGTIQGFMIVGVSVLIGRQLDAGRLRIILIIGTFMVSFGMMMTSLGKEFYQILLAQGFCIGIGCSCFFASSVATVAPYFSTRRATALGIIASGSSLGGVIYPIMAQRLIQEIGFAWATRTIGFFSLALSLIPLVILRSRIPPRQSGPLIDLASLKEAPYVCFMLSLFFAYIGLFVPLFYLEAFATQLGVNQNIALYSISILNSASIFGRLVPNIFADKFGVINMLIPNVAAFCLLCYAWIAVKGNGGVIIFAILVGFTSGCLVSLTSPVLAFLTKDLTKLGTRIGMAFGVGSLGVLIGAPVAGALINRENGDFLGAQLLAGTSMVISTFLMLVTRQLLVGRKIAIKV